jgi:hypothetical protein
VLVPVPVPVYCYLMAGILELGGCVLGYFLVFLQEGIPAADIVGFGDKENVAITLSSTWP